MVFKVNASSFSDHEQTVNNAPEELLNFHERRIFEIVNFVFLGTIIGLFGMLSNIINVIVFRKQGYQNTMNISFIALAISDECCLVTLQWYNVFMNPLVIKADKVFAPDEVHALLGGWPHVSFSRITGWITVYITAERCLCVTAPLAVKRIITPRRTTLALIFIYLINISILVPEYIAFQIGWKYFPDNNQSLLGVLVTSNSEQIEGIVFFMHAVLVLVSFVCVVFFTAVLVIKLNGASAWRRQATKAKSEDATMATKDKKATKMVAMIAGLLIAMYTPGILMSLMRFIEPRFGLFGAFQNLFKALTTFSFLCQAINSSVNIFMYYNMSSNYRETFNMLFSAVKKFK